MALKPYTTIQSGGDTTQELYSSVLGRWLKNQQEMRAGFASAEQPLTEAVGLMQPGGGYGAGQTAIIEEEAKKANAQALADLVSTGMSSGSNVTGARARVTGEATKAKLGVEDVRIQNLMQALTQLSGMRSAAASQIGQTQEPTYGPMMGSLTSRNTALMGLAGQLMSRPSEPSFFGQGGVDRSGTKESSFEIPKLHL